MTSEQHLALLAYCRASESELPAAIARLIASGLVSPTFGRWPDAEPEQAKLPLAAE